MTIVPQSYSDLEDYEAGFADGRAGRPVVIPQFGNDRAYLEGYDDGVNAREMPR